ncbi:MAG TPA: hypothetical protein DHW45_06975 [Candidatus Latescibacteria bacterium]|jgi:hypothetical protein|nr:hypothetical protein [Candidatus Latescibacterota bacterium]
MADVAAGSAAVVLGSIAHSQQRPFICGFHAFD